MTITRNCLTLAPIFKLTFFHNNYFHFQIQAYFFGSFLKKENNRLGSVLTLVFVHQKSTLRLGMFKWGELGREKLRRRVNYF